MSSQSSLVYKSSHRYRFVGGTAEELSTKRLRLAQCFPVVSQAVPLKEHSTTTIGLSTTYPPFEVRYISVHEIGTRRLQQRQDLELVDSDTNEAVAIGDKLIYIYTQGA
jgi:hypothetical protein